MEEKKMPKSKYNKKKTKSKKSSYGKKGRKKY